MGNEQIITLICGVIGATGIGGMLVKWILSKVSKVREKFQAPILEKFEKFLYSKLPDTLTTTRETFVKESKATGEWEKSIQEHDSNIEKAMNISYKSLTDGFPKYIAGWAKILFDNPEKAIKTYIKDYYEKHKSLINGENKIIEE